jgi:hypothetical protein
MTKLSLRCVSHGCRETSKKWAIFTVRPWPKSQIRRWSVTTVSVKDLPRVQPNCLQNRTWSGHTSLTSLKICLLLLVMFFIFVMLFCLAFVISCVISRKVLRWLVIVHSQVCSFAMIERTMLIDGGLFESQLLGMLWLTERKSTKFPSMGQQN